jgi:phospholipase/lecithinase/hemolysin
LCARLACGLALTFSLAGPTRGETFSDIYFFGDSLSDTGSACSLLVFVGYAPGRCSNGYVWSDFLAASLGFEAVAWNQRGNNFANGGDTTSDLHGQVGLFRLTVLFGGADPDALYVVWLGGNDVLGLPSDPNAMQHAVDNILAGIAELEDLGAQHFLVLNLPDIGRVYGSFSIPAGSGPILTPAERDLATSLSLDFNARLAQGLEARGGLPAFELDVFAAVEELFARPGDFGVVPAAIDTTSDDTDFAIPCLLDTACAADPQGPTADGFILFDAIHPTTAVHQELGHRAAALVPEPDRRVLLGLGVLATALLALRRRQWARVSPLR